MVKCTKCKINHLISPGWNEPPCIYPSSSNIFQLPQYQKLFFNDVLCTCGNIIGIKVFSGLKQEVGKWRIFEDKKQEQEQYKNIKPTVFRKFVFEKSLKNNISLALQEENQNQLMIYAIEKLLRVMKRKQK